MTELSHAMRPWCLHAKTFLPSALAAAVLLGTLSPSAPARADEEDDAAPYAAQAVQKRLYMANHELSLHLGVFPLDAFTKGVAVGGSYTYHFTELFAWEAVNAQHSFHSDTDLRADLEALAVEPTPFEVLENLVTSNFIFKPVYWKGAWLNRALIHGEFFLAAGGGYAWFTRTGRVALDYGGGVRLYAHKWISARLDVRHIIFLNDEIFSNPDLEHDLWLALGVSFSL